MNYQRFHDLTFDVLYGCIVVLLYVILERGSYLTYLSWRMHRLAGILDGGEQRGRRPVSYTHLTLPTTERV